MKNGKRLFWLLVILVVVTIGYVYAGKVEMTTYYPAPYGEYKKIVTKKLEVNSAADETPVTIKANNPQSNTNPLLKFLKSDGTTELLRVHSDRTSNLFIGSEAGNSNIPDSGSSNTFVGWVAGKRNTTGGENTVVGSAAFSLNTTGGWNTALGSLALNSNTTATGNSAVGSTALQNTTGERNTALGMAAGNRLTTGTNNTIVGAFAGNGQGQPGDLASVFTGSNSTFLGYCAGLNANQKTDAVNSMALGANTYTTADNQVVIGNDSITQTLLKGNVGIGTTAPANKLDVNGDVNISSGHTYKINGVAPYLFKGRTIVTTNNQEYVPPAGVRALYVQCWGAGGGGGGAQGDWNQAAQKTYSCVGGGGGAGGYAELWMNNLTFYTPQLITVCKIGAGGTGGVGRNNGVAGGSTSFEYRIPGSPQFDTAAVKANGGSGGSTSAVSGDNGFPPGGAGADTAGAVGDLVSGGGSGATGIKYNNVTLRAGGGASTAMGGGGKGAIDTGIGENGGNGTGYGAGGGG
ncbi:MAG: hypothetical protein HY589_03720, partial [Candidatus Omnitrophica bacterium]|nr:hypothetical protein [Candidatus Omnitrophota bacterium]